MKTTCKDVEPIYGFMFALVDSAKEYTKTDMYEYLKIASNDFDRNIMEYLIKDVRDFVWHNPIWIRDDIKRPFGLKKYNISDILLSEFLESMEITDFEFSETKTLKQRVEKIENRFSTIIELYKCVKLIEFSDIAESEYKRVIESTSSETTHTPKQVLIFDGLFQPEYRAKLNILFERLRLNGFTDENNNRLIKNGTNEPAKLFHYLKEKGVIIAPKFKPAIACFYNKFGCEVVEKDNGNPRATTRKNANEAKNSVIEKEFDNFLLTWINKK